MKPTDTRSTIPAPGVLLAVGVVCLLFGCLTPVVCGYWLDTTPGLRNAAGVNWTAFLLTSTLLILGWLKVGAAACLWLEEFHGGK